MARHEHDDARQRQEKLRQAFFNAARRGKKGDVESLLAAGAPVNAKDANGASALFFAVNSGNVETTTALLAKGAAVNARIMHGFIIEWDTFPEGATPLTIACGRNFSGIALLLLDKGAEANAADAYGLTPLHYAAKRGNSALAEQLIAHGANRDAIDKNGHTPAYFARENGYKTLAEELSRNGKKPPRFHL